MTLNLNGIKRHRLFESTNRFVIRMMRQAPVLGLLVCFIAGILIDDGLSRLDSTLLSLTSRTSLWIVALLVSCGLLFSLSRSARQTNGCHLGRRLALGFIILMLGGLDHDWQDSNFESATVLDYLDQEYRPAIVEGSVCAAAVLRSHPLAKQRSGQGMSPWQTQIQVDVARFQVGRRMLPLSGRVFVSVDGKADHFLPGDSLRMLGSIHRSEAPSNPGSMDRRETDRRRLWHARMEIDRVEQIRKLNAGGNDVGLINVGYRAIARIANSGRETLLTTLDQTTGPLAIALVLGQRDFVDQTTRDALLETGTAHLLSVSGMHLAIVVSIATLIALIFRFPLAVKVLFVFAVCCFYTALTGARPPVIRAALLVSIFLVGIWKSRPSQPLNTLALAALLIVAWNPENLFGVGVQLSFLAVATLLVAGSQRNMMFFGRDDQIDHANQDRLQDWVDATRSRWIILGLSLWRGTKTAMWFSLIVTIASMPLVWYQFHVVSPISVITNVILSPFLFAALASGIATVVAGAFDPIVAMVPGFVCQIVLGCMMEIITVAQSVPAGHFWLPSPPGYWIAVFYIVITTTLLLPKSRKSLCVRGLAIALWTTVAWYLSVIQPYSMPEDCLEAIFVDVGHGTCVVLRSDDETWLYDCGRLGNERGSSRDIESVLWSLGVVRIQGVILSHADADHFNSLPGLLKRFSVDRIVTPPGMIDESEPALDPIRAAILSHQVPIEEVSVDKGQIKLGEMNVSILHPGNERIPGSDNANSLVIQIDHAGRSLILPGDLEPPGTEVLINKKRPVPGGILMAPHHGSLAMDAESILQWARPAVCIVSGGKKARRVEVQEMLAARGSRVLVTADVGAIRVRLCEGDDAEFRTWLASPW